MVEITEFNREPASTVSTLTATTEVTSPSVTADALEATRAIGNATYQSESDVPNDLTVGEQVWIESDNRTLVEDGT